LKIDNGITLKLNTLGDGGSRAAWRAALIEHFEAHRGELSEDSLTRLAVNPMRILDSKDPRDRPVADAAPDIDMFLTDEARDFFDSVTGGLDAAGVKWTRDARLVRGLDYYRHTAFEFVTDRLGAQGTVLGGGRYDGLIETLGGPHTPAVGWAAGIERLGMMVEAPATLETIVILADGDDMIEKAQKVANLLREKLEDYRLTEGIKEIYHNREFVIELCYKTNQKKQFDKYKRSGAALVITVRPDRPPDADITWLDFSRPDMHRWPHHHIGSFVSSFLSAFQIPAENSANPYLGPRGYRIS
jgi:histidyl-tRNA synthetase